jgi:hypothetical protein
MSIAEPSMLWHQGASGSVPVICWVTNEFNSCAVGVGTNVPGAKRGAAASDWAVCSVMEVTSAAEDRTAAA